MKKLLEKTTEISLRYIDTLQDRNVFPSPEAINNLAQLEEALPDEPTDPATVIQRLDDIGSPATVASAAYLVEGDKGEPHHSVPEMSRRARGVEIWAAWRSLRRKGLADMIERTCRHASRFAAALNAAGYQVLNDVVINQVLVSFGDAETTLQVIEGIQADGSCWCGSTQWQGHTAMRISVSSWATTMAIIPVYSHSPKDYNVLPANRLNLV